MNARRKRPVSDTIVECRSCGEQAIVRILDLGETPLADRLLTAEQLDQPEFFAPLKVMFCPDCSLVQISETVSPEILFGDDYPYFSSVSPALQEHFRQSAERLIETRPLGPESLGGRVPARAPLPCWLHGRPAFSWRSKFDPYSCDDAPAFRRGRAPA